MTRHVNISDLVANPSAVFEQVRQGDEVVVLDEAGELARIVPSTQAQRHQRLAPGWGKGMIEIVGDVFAPLPKEIEDEFYR